MYEEVKSIIKQEDREIIISEYQNGNSVLSLSKKFPYKYDAIHGLIKRSGIEIRGNDKTARKYQYNVDFFNVIDTEEKAYWMGFIYADGYITKRGNTHQLGIAISTEDRSHLEKFAKSLSSDLPVHDYISDNSYSDKTEYSRILISNNHICEQLMLKGAVRKKTNILTFPKQHIPDELMNHFIRGYYDGDGCLTGSYLKSRDCVVYQMKILSTMEFLNGMNEEFSKIINYKFNPRKRHEKLKNNFTLEIGGRLQVQRLLEYLYEDATIFLDRKYEKYLEFVDYHKDKVNDFKRIVHRY